MAEQNTSANSSQPTSYLSTTALYLLHSSLSESTKASYKRSWMLFQQFCLQGNVSNKLPISEITLCNFIAYLFEQNYSQWLPPWCQLLAMFTKFLTYQTIPNHLWLEKLFLGRTSQQKHLITLLLQCLFSVAFHGFFRMGELIAKTSSNHARIIQRKDVSFNGNSSVELILRHLKNHA